MDTRRHAPLGRVRHRLVPSTSRSRPHAYLGPRRPAARRNLRQRPRRQPSERPFPLAAKHMSCGRRRGAGHLGCNRRLDGRTGERADIWERWRSTPLALRLPTARSTACAGRCPRPTSWCCPPGPSATASFIPDGDQAAPRRPRIHASTSTTCGWWRGWPGSKIPGADGAAVQSASSSTPTPRRWGGRPADSPGGECR